MLADLPPCRCRLHESSGDEADWDAMDQKLISDVEGHGWHLVGLHPRPGQPAWVFSVGLWHTFRQPEVSMFGLQMPDMGTWINRIGEQIRAGNPPHPDELRSGVLEGFDVQWRAVHESWYRDLFGYGIWFYQSWFPMLQMVWPDRVGKWPWEPECGQRCKSDQPTLWLPAEEHPLGQWRYGTTGLQWLWPDQPERKVFLSKRIVELGAPIVYVVHDSDGDWEFLDGGSATTDDITVAHLGDMVSKHPWINEFHDLPIGWQAWTKRPDGPWKREQIPT